MNKRKLLISVILFFFSISVYSQTMIINEIMFKPGQALTGTASNQGLYAAKSREYVELYNSDCSVPKDISGWVIASRNLDLMGGAFVFPAGTVIPPGSFLIFGGPDEACTGCSSAAAYQYEIGSIDLKLSLYVGTANLCLASQGWVLSNYDGWMAIYEPDGTPHSAVYWSGNASNINTMADFDYTPCSPGAYSGVALKSIKAIKALNPSIVIYAGDPSAVSIGKTFSRIPDGGPFTVNASPTIGVARTSRCNDGLCLACGNLTLSSTPDTCGTHNGTITANIADTLASPGPYSYKLTGTATAGPFTSNLNHYQFSNLALGIYVVTVIDNFTPPNTTIDTIIVGVTGSLTIQNATTTPAGCTGNDGSATVVVNGTGSSFNYSWNTNPVQHTATASNLAQGNYSVTVTSGGCTTSTSVVVINNGMLNVQSITSTPAGCNASDGTATVVVIGAIPPCTYAWSTNPSQSTATATNLSQGSYTVTVTSGICITSCYVQVTSIAGPNVTTSYTPEHCDKGNGTITVNATSPTGTCSYQWSPAQPNSSTLTGLSGGSYMLTVSDGGVCDYKTTITIANIPGAVAAFTANPEFAQPGIPINFTSSNTSASAWHWDFGNGSTFSGSPNATQSYVEQGVYTVHLTIVDNNGCVDSTTQIVTIVTVLIPNVITPNGDYENDYFVIKGLEDVPNKLVRIYNRWGRKVFESGDYQNNWNADGFDDGVYYYTLWVEVLKKEYHGSLTVFKQ